MAANHVPPPCTLVQDKVPTSHLPSPTSQSPDPEIITFGFMELCLNMLFQASRELRKSDLAAAARAFLNSPRALHIAIVLNLHPDCFHLLADMDPSRLRFDRQAYHQAILERKRTKEQKHA